MFLKIDGCLINLNQVESIYIIGTNTEGYSSKIDTMRGEDYTFTLTNVYDKHEKALEQLNLIEKKINEYCNIIEIS